MTFVRTPNPPRREISERDGVILSLAVFGMLFLIGFIPSIPEIIRNWRFN